MRLSIQKSDKQYPNGVKAIDHVSLELGPGMFGLLGRTAPVNPPLMRTIATLPKKPDSGNVYFNEIDIAKDP
ncbi:MAG: hypothetical protein IPK21_09985 [Haliscomenobacter sp.]|nr:hypothetical protein [Haliscomenobacter sp.]